MTITLSPKQEEAIRAAMRTGHVASIDELIDRALGGFLPKSGAETTTEGQTPAEQGLGLFGSEADTALLDEVVSLAYADVAVLASENRLSELAASSRTVFPRDR